MTDLHPAGWGSSWAGGINASGQVVGSVQSADGSVSHACLWDHGAFLDLGTPGGPSGTARAINDAGQVVGNGFVLDPRDMNGDGRPEWFWDANRDGRNDLMTDLGVPSGSVDNNSFGADINNSSVVVGGLGSQVIGRAALWDASGRLTDLNSRLPRNSPWSLRYASALNDAGWIVGWAAPAGTNETHAVLLLPI